MLHRTNLQFTLQIPVQLKGFELRLLSFSRKFWFQVLFPTLLHFFSILKANDSSFKTSCVIHKGRINAGILTLLTNKKKCIRFKNCHFSGIHTYCRSTVQQRDLYSNLILAAEFKANTATSVNIIIHSMRKQNDKVLLCLMPV